MAAWFAVSSASMVGDAHVYGLDIDRPDLEILAITDRDAKALRSGGTYTGPHDLKSTIALLDVAEVSNRITNQRGIVTIHAPPTKPLAVPATDTFVITGVLREDFQKRLFDVGIDDSQIYPGLDGLCKLSDWRARTHNYPKSMV